MIIQLSLGELIKANCFALRYCGLFHSIVTPTAYCCIASSFGFAQDFGLREASTFHFTLFIFHLIATNS